MPNIVETTSPTTTGPEAQIVEKCNDCHLFIEPNSSFDDDPTLAEYVHLYGECDLCTATDETHEARPGGGVHPISWWREHGPALMRARFEPVATA